MGPVKVRVELDPEAVARIAVALFVASVFFSLAVSYNFGRTAFDECAGTRMGASTSGTLHMVVDGNGSRRVIDLRPLLSGIYDRAVITVGLDVTANSTVEVTLWGDNGLLYSSTGERITFKDKVGETRSLILWVRAVDSDTARVTVEYSIVVRVTGC